MTARRRLIVVAGAAATCALAAPLRAFAQGPRGPRVGYIISGKTTSIVFEAFQRRLVELGYADGRNFSLDRLDMEGRLDQARRLIFELAARKPNVIVLTNVASMAAAKKSGLAIPFVVVSPVDPVENGYAVSLSRPGGNFTGITSLQRDLSAKRLEALRDLLPKASRIAIVWDANGLGPKVAAAAYEAAAERLRMRLQSLPIRDPKTDLAAAFQAATREKADAMILVSNPMISGERAEIAALTARHRTALVAENESWAEIALFTFGANPPAIGRRVAELVHQIIQGAKPGDLPFELPTKFDFIINQRAARSLGIVIPQAILVRADRVID